MTARNASAVWHGGVQSGSGTITVGPCVFEGPCSAQSRFDDEPEPTPSSTNSPPPCSLRRASPARARSPTLGRPWVIEHVQPLRLVA